MACGEKWLFGPLSFIPKEGLLGAPVSFQDTCTTPQTTAWGLVGHAASQYIFTAGYPPPQFCLGLQGGHCISRQVSASGVEVALKVRLDEAGVVYCAALGEADGECTQEVLLLQDSGRLRSLGRIWASKGTAWQPQGDRPEFAGHTFDRIALAEREESRALSD